MNTLSDADVDRIADRLADRLRGEFPVDRVARRVVELLQPDERGDLIDAAEVARRFGVTREWVYQHKQRLGVLYLGDGPRPRQRYDVAAVTAAIAELREDSAPPEPPRRSLPPRRAWAESRDATSPELLPIKRSRR